MNIFKQQLKRSRQQFEETIDGDAARAKQLYSQTLREIKLEEERQIDPKILRSGKDEFVLGSGFLSSSPLVTRHIPYP